ncbi:MAG: molybdate ABC transporter permease subunit [Planctomycetes bacterium]|nr:molybdate ABC transporter permease subunit [Planctomycetota bacterium]
MMLSDAEIEVVRLSAIVAAWSVAISIVPGVLLGWLLARWNSPLRGLLQGGVMLPLVLPPVVTGFILLALFGRSGPLGEVWEAITGGRIAYTTGACVIAAAVVGFPLMVESIRLSIVGVDPRLEMISRSLGRNRWSTFLRVTLPLALPGVLGGAVLSFARALGEFGATIVLAGNVEGETRTIPVAVYTLMNTRDGEGGVFRLVMVSVAMSLAALLAAGWLGRKRRRRSRLGD